MKNFKRFCLEVKVGPVQEDLQWFSNLNDANKTARRTWASIRDAVNDYSQSWCRVYKFSKKAVLPEAYDSDGNIIDFNAVDLSKMVRGDDMFDSFYVTLFSFTKCFKILALKDDGEVIDISDLRYSSDLLIYTPASCKCPFSMEMHERFVSRDFYPQSFFRAVLHNKLTGEKFCATLIADDTLRLDPFAEASAAHFQQVLMFK